MMQSQDRDAVALSARTLGALFSFAPDSEQAAPLVAALRDGSWRSQWPYASDHHVPFISLKKFTARFLLRLFVH